MSPIVLQINVKVNVPVTEIETAWLEVAQPIADTPGLRWKVWIKNANEHEVGGIYLFDDAVSAQTFLEGPIVAAVASSPAVTEVSAKLFNIMEAHTAITHGPLGAPTSQPVMMKTAGQ